MKRSLAILALIGVGIAPAAADIPVIDKTNYAVARDTAEKTGKILDTNKEILTTVEETLKAVTGDRGSDAWIFVEMRDEMCQCHLIFR